MFWSTLTGSLESFIISHTQNQEWQNKFDCFTSGPPLNDIIYTKYANHSSPIAVPMHIKAMDATNGTSTSTLTNQPRQASHHRAPRGRDPFPVFHGRPRQHCGLVARQLSAIGGFGHPGIRRVKTKHAPEGPRFP